MSGDRGDVEEIRFCRLSKDPLPNKRVVTNTEIWKKNIVEDRILFLSSSPAVGYAQTESLLNVLLSQQQQSQDRGSGGGGAGEVVVVVAAEDDESGAVTLMRREIAKKLYGYSSQDKKKGVFAKDRMITFPETVHLLHRSRLICYYCRCSVKILYEDVRDSNQWTLDRINNEFGHFSDNVLIACLRCNLRRKVMNPAKYVLTKQFMHVTKLN